MFAVLYIILTTALTPVICDVVHIDEGCVSSTVLRSRAGIPFHAFFGIPYAAAPVGPLRFQPPAKPPSWKGIRQAMIYPLVCLQFTPAIPGYRKANYTGSEDCLYINVFTREIHPKNLQPVLVYIHGGGFRSGSGHMNGPHLFMDEQVVVVSFNHRLGFFGYLSSGDGVVPGNFGLKDQVMALKWIQKYISKFGGNPKSVTILGHNSGATSAHLHTMSPLSKGLFHRVIMQSGNAIKYLRNESARSVKKALEEVLTKVNCIRNTIEESSLCLKNLSGGFLNQFANAFPSKNKFQIRYHPVIEHSDVKNPFLVDSQYQDPSIPAIIGFNSAEGLNEAINYFKLYQNMTILNEKFDEELPLMLQSVDMRPELFPNATELIKKYYFTNGVVAKEDQQRLCDLIGDIFRSVRMIDTIRMYPGKKFFYVYDYKNTVTPTRSALFNDTKDFEISGAGHGDEIVSLFSTPVSDKLNAADRELSEQMIAYWVNFITYGDPNGPKTKKKVWKPTGTQEVLEFFHISKNGFKMESGPLKDRYTFWKSLPLEA